MSKILDKLEIGEDGEVWWKERKNYPAKPAATPTMKCFPFVYLTRSVAKYLSSGNVDDLRILDISVDKHTIDLMRKFFAEEDDAP